MKEKNYEFIFKDKSYVLSLGRCAVHLFYKMSEVDHVVLLNDEGQMADRIPNPDFAKWAAGFAPRWDDENNEWWYPTTYWSQKDSKLDGKTFHEIAGWNPLVLLNREPFESQIDWFVDEQMRGIDER